jgi:hypothetical protein
MAGESFRALVIGGTVLVAIVTGMFFAIRALDLDGPSLPDKAEAEALVTAKIAEKDHLVVTATCEEPQGRSYSCLLRDQNGRYGRSGTSFTEHDGSEGGIPFVESTGWVFPLDAAGNLTDDFELSPFGALDNQVNGTIRSAAQVLTLDGDTRADATCPHPDTGQTVTCAVTGLLRSATLARTGTYRYRLNLSFLVPPGR